jgi:hypothetical protein
MMRKHFKKIVILSLFFLLVSGFGIKHAVSKGKPKVSAWICMTVDGDITAATACHNQGIMHNTTQLIVRPMVSDLNYFMEKTFKTDGDGANCFRDGIRVDDNITLAVVKERDGSAWARVYFWAYVNDGITELLYGLHMYGTFDGPWPPQNGVGNPTFVHLNSWEMVSEGKGKLRRVSCTGSGEFPTGVTITVTREDL